MQFNDPLPAAEESERNIVGALLVHPERILEVKDQLSADRLSTPTLRSAYAAMVDIVMAGEEVTVSAIIARAPELSVSWLTGLTYGAVDLGLKHDIARVISAARRRWMLQFSDRWQKMISETEMTEDELLSFAAQKLDEARTKLPQSKQRARFLSEMIDDQATRYRLWHKGISNAIPTGFDFIDSKLLGGGLIPSGLYVLAARPSMGKSSLALDISSNVARENKIVYIVSREMPSESLLDRLHAAAAGVARWKLRAGIYQKEYQTLINTLPAICEMPIVLDNASLTVGDVRATCRELERKHRKPEMVVIDYLQLMDGGGRSRNDEVGSVTRGLKGLAMELDIPILALSQLSRECDKQRREPELSDLRDSGEIEQDADAVFFLFGDKPEEGAKFFSRNFKCSKQRDGELFRQEMIFNGDLVTFRSFEQLAANGIHDYTGTTI